MIKFKQIFGYLASFTILLLSQVVPIVTVQAQDMFPSDLPEVTLTRDGVYELFLAIASLAIFLLPGIALLFIIFGAFKIITGDEKGWSLIKNSLIGLAIAGLSFLIVGLATGLLNSLYAGDLISLS